jgi:hypothetical protein
MESRQYLKMLMRGQQPQPRKAKTFFVLDGKVHPQGIEEIEGGDDFILAIVTSKADIEVWEAFSKAGKDEACNKVTKADLAAWEHYQIISDLPRDLPEPER